MNKVFKVIWSEARNAYVVVSEIAKNHGSKSCSTKKLLTMLIATGVMTCASMAPAMAADPPAEALKHSTVTNGYNITVTEGLKDGGKEYNVALNNDIYLAGDDPDAFVSISGSKGTIWATGSVTAGSVEAGSVVMDSTTETVSGLSNKTTAYAGFANGEGKAATEEQLKEISEVAENANQGWNLSTNGGEASKVAPGETVDFSGDKNINISNDGTNVKVKLNDDIDVKSVQTNVLNAKYNLSVGTANENGTVPFFVNSNGSFYAANGKLVVDKDGKLVAPEAELGKVTADEGE
ncbi:ESPR domain-containing protein, partial [Phascolarctobacterium succinatutens]|uniref:ESPR domain-containing protein n=1 Tax=Phascolarctobacterium succinatutens TaxID=626940 RepID=UPI0026EE5CEA